MVYVLLGGVAILYFWTYILARRFKTACIEGDPACPIREQGRIWDHIGWFSKSSEEKSYVRRHAPWLFLANRVTMLWVFVTVTWLAVLMMNDLSGA